MGFQGKGDLSVWSLTSGRPCIRQITHLTLFTKEEQLIFFLKATQIKNFKLLLLLLYIN